MNFLNELYQRTKASPAYKRKAARALVTADLRILIANAGKSHKEVAEAVGISPAALSAKLSGEKNLTLDSITDMAAALGKEYDIVFRDAGTARLPQAWEARAALTEIQAMHEDASARLDKAGAILDGAEMVCRFAYRVAHGQKTVGHRRHVRTDEGMECGDRVAVGA